MIAAPGDRSTRPQARLSSELHGGPRGEGKTEMRSPTFEVQTFKNGRWLIERRCRSEQEALAEADELYAHDHCKAIKVVKEAFDHSEKLYRESLILRHPPTQAKAAAAPAPRPKTKRPIIDGLKE